MIYVSPSQLESFNCRLAWLWGTRKRLQSRRRDFHFDLGEGVHYGLERYYKENKDPVKVFRRWIEQKLAETNPQWDEDIKALLKARTLGLGMLEGYIKTYRQKEPLEALVVEGEMSRDLGDDRSGRPTNIAVTTRIDTIVRDRVLDQLFVLEHKTFTQFNGSQLDRDQQFVAEQWVAQQWLDKPIAGVIYNGLRKQLPGPRVKLALFERQYIYINKHQVRHFLNRVFHVGMMITAAYRDKLAMYPEPSYMRCQRCPFREPCTAYVKGDDYQYILDTLFEEKPKREYNNKHKEGLAHEDNPS